MTTSLCSIILTTGADKMAVSDPHGWTLTLISVLVVFSALVILYGLYSLSGQILSGRFKKEKVSGKGDEPAIAAAIALALEAETSSDEVEAAIATALHLYLGESVHDIEPGFITIRPKDNTNWKFRNLR